MLEGPAAWSFMSMRNIAPATSLWMPRPAAPSVPTRTGTCPGASRSTAAARPPDHGPATARATRGPTR
ncbi:hypothetical protein G6F66_015539 [Rhizopus arrhizus]|nr:hypothetical protein G6F66_015539 [Rhizopus arrhizus]